MVAFILELPVRLKLASFKSDLRELKRLSVHVLYALGERDLKISRVIIIIIIIIKVNYNYNKKFPRIP